MVTPMALGAVPQRSANSRCRFSKCLATVRGPIRAESLGPTLVHEHVLVDFIGADRIVAGRYDPEEVFKKAIPFLQRLRATGCRAFVDCTPAHLGRDPRLLHQLSIATGLHMVTNTGFYGAADDKYLPRFVYDETAEQLADRWSREFEEGIPPSQIRPGFIKIGVDAGPLSAVDRKLVVAAALAHKRTGLAIASHTGDGTAAMAELEVLKEQGVPLSAFIWVHAQNEPDGNLHRRAAELGAWVEFDGVSPEAAAKHVELVLSMKRSGNLRRLLISQDAGWYHVGEPGGGSFRPYDLLFTDFLPTLRQAGLREKDIRTLTVRNPREAFALRA